MINVASNSHTLVSNREFLVQMFEDSIKNETFMSNDYKKYFHSITNYGISKSCNILFSRELARRMNVTNDGVVGSCSMLCVSVHPGGCSRTSFSRYSGLHEILYLLYWFFIREPTILYKDRKSQDQIASSILQCVVENPKTMQNGGYYVNCHLCPADEMGGVCKEEFETNSHKLSKLVWKLSTVLIKSRGIDMCEMLSASEKYHG